MKTPTQFEIVAIVIGVTVAILILLLLLIYFIRKSQQITKENKEETDNRVKYAAEILKQRDTWKNEATKLAAEKEALNARLETDTLVFGRELQAVQEERDTLGVENNILKSSIDERIVERKDLTNKCQTLAEMVRNLTAKLAETNEALETASTILENNFISKRGKGARDASGRFTTVDEQKEYSAPTPVKQLSEVNAENGYKLPAATFNNGGQVPAHGNEKKEEPLKIGDWVHGKLVAFDKYEEGEIEAISTVNNNPKVNKFWLELHTCRRVTRPVEVQPTEEISPDNSHAGEQVASAAEPFDPTKYKAFPGNYIIPEGTAVFAISDSDKHPFKAINKKAVVNKCRNKIAECEFEAGIKCMLVHELAPLDPRQHPEHPEFKSAE